MFVIPLCKCSFFFLFFLILDSANSKVIIIMDTSSVEGCHGNVAEGQPTWPFCSDISQEQSWRTQAFSLESSAPQLSELSELKRTTELWTNRAAHTADGRRLLLDVVFVLSGSPLILKHLGSSLSSGNGILHRASAVPVSEGSGLIRDPEASESWLSLIKLRLKFC